MRIRYKIINILNGGIISNFHYTYKDAVYEIRQNPLVFLKPIIKKGRKLSGIDYFNG